MTWSDVVVRVNNHWSIEYVRISAEGGTAKGSVGVSKSKILVELANKKAWQPFDKTWDCDFYVYQKDFPRTWGAGMQWWLWYVRNIGCSGC